MRLRQVFMNLKRETLGFNCKSRKIILEEAQIQRKMLTLLLLAIKIHLLILYEEKNNVENKIATAVIPQKYIYRFYKA